MTHFEYLYDVGFVILAQSMYGDINIDLINIYSETINSWVGITETQGEILNSYAADPYADDIFDKYEILEAIDNFGYFSIRYSTQVFQSSTDYGAGIKFPPFLQVFKEDDFSGNSAMTEFLRIYNFISVLCGKELSIEKIKLIDSEFDHFVSAGYLYFPKFNSTENFSGRIIVYPLGHKIAFDSLGLPPLPLSSINNYFNLNSVSLDKWSKYIKYRRMSNVEDRFLGYFRLLESIVEQKKNYLDPQKLDDLIERFKPAMIDYFGDAGKVRSFLKRIPRLNQSYYNTAACVGEFYKTLPDEAKGSWRLGLGDIQATCDLRNDITHANPYNNDEYEILEKCSFIEAMLVFALFDMVGIPKESTAKAIYRLPYYSCLRKNK